MRSLFLVAGLLLASPLLAGPGQAQEAAQRELNALTGAPEGTRCFQSMVKAQEMAKHYIASGLCPQQISPMHPAEFMEALEQQNVSDDDFTSEACQVQLKLMFRAGREWLSDDLAPRCSATAEEMMQRPHFRNYVLGR